MLPMSAIRLKLGTLLAADTASLAPATANKMILFSNNVTPIETLLMAALTEANFDGYASIDGTIVAQETGIDPATGDQVITLTPPLGGWHWKTTGVTNLPETIYGFALVDHAKAVLLAIETFEEPVSLTAIGQQIDLGAATMRLVQEPAS
jgi:hypothetical protein